MKYTLYVGTKDREGNEINGYMDKIRESLKDYNYSINPHICKGGWYNGTQLLVEESVEIHIDTEDISAFNKLSADMNQWCITVTANGVGNLWNTDEGWEMRKAAEELKFNIAKTEKINLNYTRDIISNIAGGVTIKDHQDVMEVSVINTRNIPNLKNKLINALL